MVIQLISNQMKKIFGTRNERLVKTYFNRVEQINALEGEISKLTDSQLKAKTVVFHQRIADGEAVERVLPEIMAVAREVMDRSVGIRNVFNPAEKFNASRLPGDVQGMYQQVAEQIAGMEPVEELGCQEPVPGWMQVEIPVAIYEAVRELIPESRPPFRARPFDVQLIGGMVLSEGTIAEMKTGEGKTIVAPLACYAAAMEGLQCHVVTTNDYLVQRDRDWVFPFYYHLGLTVGAIHPFHMQPHGEKQKAYKCNVVYGTNAEFGFDYLRDNMKLSTEEQVQEHRDFCIVDEVDSILIDEARTPLIISGPAHDDAPRYGVADTVARHLIKKQRDWNAADKQLEKANMRATGLEGDIRNSRDKQKIAQMREELAQLQEEIPKLEANRDQFIQYYEVEMDKKASHLTHEGVAEAQKQANIGSFYVGENMDFPHLLENALRAHAVYQANKDYVVQNGEVIIVDEFTGRLMIGRQWSDGLHQAVEAKENVRIKQETQTLATVTIQNFCKLYKRLAGMTGTAITEATEFAEIYGMDVVCIPTNRPVIRDDRNDLIFISVKDKWNAILDEIKRVHDIGQPVLVGTTSVENSEMLSQMLTKRHGIEHEVLNAKIDQVAREAGIVEHAGELGAVMIATNMAGRGTDIKLRSVDREILVRHWQTRNVLPREAKADMPEDELVSLANRHMARMHIGLKPRDIQEMSDEGIRLMLLRHWVQQELFVSEGRAGSMSADQCCEMLDRVPNFRYHRLKLFENTEQLGGLHIVGTERHEARRIDNQLRGRSGRQGDHGSSRFFISLEDDLMKMFAGKTTMTALSKLGMKEGDALEHKWITKSVERAQRKVEERNYEIRKNLLEYDEVMEAQRGFFYGIRQDVLEGHDTQQIIFDYITDSVEDAVTTYLDRNYVPEQIAEWCRQTLDVPIEIGKLRTKDAEELKEIIGKESEAETRQIIGVTLGEYMSNDLSAEEWDLRGLSSWAMSRFGVDLKHNQLKSMTIDEVRDLLSEAAVEKLADKDLTGVEKYLDELYGQKQLCEWAMQKFGLKVDPKEIAEFKDGGAVDFVLNKARDAYNRREVTYPIEFTLDLVFQMAQNDQNQAAQHLVGWINRRLGLTWSTEQVLQMSGKDIRDALVLEAEKFLNGGGLSDVVDRAMAEHKDGEALVKWVASRFGREVEVEDLENLEGDELKQRLVDEGRKMYRAELAHLERFVLLQILDASWKDHLYAMDQLKDSVGLRGYAEKDPRIEYKREGSNLFNKMQQTVRDRVTELIFRARLTANVEVRNVYGEQEAQHAPAEQATSAAAAATAGTSQQQADLDAADRAGGGREAVHKTRKQRRAEAATSDRPDRAKQGGRVKPRRRKRRK